MDFLKNYFKLLANVNLINAYEKNKSYKNIRVVFEVWVDLSVMRPTSY